MDSLLLGVVVCVFVWLFMRRIKQRRNAPPEATPAAAATEPDEAPKTMPRYGTPGTVTPAQLEQLQANDFEPSRLWSDVEASLILDALAYARETIRRETGDTDAPVEVQNKVLQFVLAEDETREYLLDWRRNLTREEEDAGATAVQDDDIYDRVAGYVQELWEDA